MLDFTYIYILTAIALMILFSVVRRSSYLARRKNRFYMLAISADICILLGYVGRDLSEQLSVMPLAHISNTLIYLCAPLSMFFLILAASERFDKFIGICAVLEAISVIIALCSPFTGWFYTVSADVIYSRGPLYIYNEVLGVLFTVVWAIYSFIEFRYIETSGKIYLAELFVFQVASIIVQGLNSTYKIIYICGAFSIMIYYAFVTEVYGKYDRLTGVRNSLYYHAMMESAPPAAGYSVIMVDANGLKQANDTYGHAAGDRLICEVAAAMVKSVGKKGAVYRIGGDEFVAVIRSTDAEYLGGIERAIHEQLSQIADTEVSASTGAAVNSEGESFADTVSRADKLMYENKNQYYIRTGKDRRRH